MEAYNTLRENNLTCEILTPLPILGKFGPTPHAFELDINFPILVTDDNMDGLVDSIMSREHPRVPYVIHQKLLQKLESLRIIDELDPNIYTTIDFNLNKYKKFLQEITNQDEAYEQIKYVARKWCNPYPIKPFSCFDLH